ncbi:major facilitator superfamily domain-containing protein [Talaromyces proteolyticus]|uniref:Major facilitator superfamily domain-containing protein n=1 Tax=Talaromyces proteolyticus TaxID=1131652 RepID=A0AAD4KI03_9EURO|nr:major facilitator superfamily domain-containing protein [Talaromyces proteolyticus]KAH8691637.1 major facilitator superfamily domain-containing protein [Talaromyces proteolyticus]
MGQVDQLEAAGPPKTEPTPTLPPEEGLAGWLCVFGAFLGFLATFGFLNAIGVFQTTYEQTTLKDYSASEIAWIFALQLALMWAPGPFFGRLVDTYGPQLVMYPSSLLCVFALCMTSLSTKYYQIFLAQGLAYGIGAGGVFTTGMVCTGQWFVKRRGLGIGVAAAGSSLGGVIFPLFFNKVMEQVGFYGTVRYTALFIGIVLAMSCLLVKSRLPRKQWNRDLKWVDVSLLRDKQFALYSFGSFFGMWGLWAPFDFLPSMAQSAGFSPSLALYLISIINAASIPGRILPSYLGDRLGHYNVMTIVMVITSLAIISLWVPFNYHYSHAGLVTFSAVYGFSSGAFVSLLMPCAAKAGSLDTLGQRFGTFQSLISISCLTGLPIMGAILARQNNSDFLGLQLFGGCSILLGAGLTGVSTLILGQRNMNRKV